MPLYILGSSLFGAQLAAALGLPYAFASHFAPAALHDALAIYRERFEPSAQLERPYVMAGVGVIAADTAEAAAYVDRFQQQTGADELITVHYNDSVENRLRSVELLAEATLGAT